MGYHLLAADFDLTLSRADRTVSERSKRAIRAAEEAGLRVALASGRMPPACTELLPYFSPDTPAILGNGSLLILPRTGEVLWEEAMEEETALTMMEWLFRRDFGVTMVWTRSRLYASAQNAFSRQYCRVVSVPAEELTSPEKAARQGICKLLFFASPEDVSLVRRQYGEERPAEVNCFPSGNNTLELVGPGVDKGAGLLRCASLLGIPREETAAIGDAGNDVAMLRSAGLGAAVENASEEAKSAAKLIVPSCEEDGVAWLIENVLL